MDTWTHGRGHMERTHGRGHMWRDRTHGRDHIAHVRTQLPYALAVALVVIAFGTLPLGWGVSVWFLLPLQLGALVVLLLVVGGKV